MSHSEDPLAYGHYHSQDDGSGEGTARGFVGDTFKKLKNTYKTHHGQPGGAHGDPAGAHGVQSFSLVAMTSSAPRRERYEINRRG